MSTWRLEAPSECLYTNAIQRPGSEDVIPGRSASPGISDRIGAREAFSGSLRSLGISFQLCQGFDRHADGFALRVNAPARSVPRSNLLQLNPSMGIDC